MSNVWEILAKSRADAEPGNVWEILAKSGSGAAAGESDPAMTRLIADARKLVEQVSGAVKSGKLSTRAALRQVERIRAGLAAIGQPRASSGRRRVQENRRRPAPRRSTSLRESVRCTLNLRGLCRCPLCVPRAA